MELDKKIEELEKLIETIEKREKKKIVKPKIEVDDKKLIKTLEDRFELLGKEVAQLKENVVEVDEINKMIETK